ncbi:hypothetical protein R5S71_004682 [Salmonella enterica]|nr:hypothetical protein [Salmonella enterica]EHD2124103.1 hypothetical protein [Salmonella enterica]EJB2593652.1 hypothetical protein [Salmonella enterica]ELS6506708.1 hypothetical protein [Salmonella enterica]OIN14362.1 hypothetical protein AO411_2024105 [Salmonella enterica subsp. enterica serovar Sarajane]
MKLNLSDIKFSGFGYVSSIVEVEVGPYPHLLSMCTMHVSVPLVEGKTLEQYKEELLAQARERIVSMYKEIVCGGKHQIRVVNKNGKLSVAGVGDDSGADYPEKRPADEALDGKALKEAQPFKVESGMILINNVTIS